MVRARTGKWLAGVALVASLGVAMAGAARAQRAGDADPYVWLEDKDGARAQVWVAAENARTLPRLQSDPRYKQFYDEALAIAEKCREAVEALQILHARSGCGAVVTVSVGVGTVIPPDDGQVRHFCEAVDKRLYAAKQAGRNRVVSTFSA